MAEDNAFDYSAHFPNSAILAAQDAGKSVRDNPASVLPPLAGWGQQPTPEDRDTILSALMGLNKSMEASQAASRYGDPFTAAIAALSGAAAQPGPQAIANQRVDMARQAQLRALEAAPVEAVSPALVQAHPELKGIPLAIVNQIAPIIEKANAFQDAHYNLDQAASLMAPSDNPSDIAAKKAQLAKQFPNGIVPKDFAHVGATNSRMEQQFGNKLSLEQQKQVTALSEALDLSKARGGQGSIAQSKFNTAERIQTLANAVKNGNLDSRQLEELAISVQNLLSGGNAGSVEQVKGLVPKTVIGDANKFKEWLTNNPTGTGQQAFVQRLLDTVQREKEVAADQIKRIQFQRIAGFPQVEKVAPEQWRVALLNSGVDPEEYQKWRAQGSKPISAVQSSDNSSGGASRFKIVAVE